MQKKTQKTKTAKTHTPHKVIMQHMCKVYAIPEPMLEFKFLQNRKFRFDFAWTEYMLAVEIEGGVWIQGRHTRGSGFVKDMEKYNLAACEGWRILRFTPQQLKQEATYMMIRKTMEKHDEQTETNCNLLCSCKNKAHEHTAK